MATHLVCLHLIRHYLARLAFGFVEMIKIHLLLFVIFIISNHGNHIFNNVVLGLTFDTDARILFAWNHLVLLLALLTDPFVFAHGFFCLLSFLLVPLRLFLEIIFIHLNDALGQVVYESQVEFAVLSGIAAFLRLAQFVESLAVWTSPY